MKYIALLVLAFLQVVLGVVLTHKRHSKISKTLLEFTVVLFGWTLTNILLDHSVSATSGVWANTQYKLEILNWANRLGFSMGVLSIVMLYRLIRVLPYELPQTKTSQNVIRSGLVLLIVALLPIVSGLYVVGQSPATPVYKSGALASLIIVYFAIVALLAIKEVSRLLRSAAEPKLKRQTRTILISLLTTAATALIIIIILPSVVGTDSFIFLGYFSPYIFTTAVFYSIFRQGFLDFRALVARSVGYTFSLVFLASIYTLVIFSLAEFFFKLDISLGAEIFLAASTAAIALAFQPLKIIFDKLTTKIFYRDSYDAQDLFAQLNKILVSSLDVKYLMVQSISVIETYLKPDFAVIGLRDNEAGQRIFASRKVKFTQQDINHIWAHMPQIHHKVILVDDLDEAKHANFKKIMQTNKVAVLLRIAQNVRSDEEGLGYLALGIKKSGNPYGSQDIRTLEAVANELVLAIQNALHFEEIQRFNVELQTRVDDATRKLRQTNEKLKALDETKDDFISMASHQLRTPLTSVKGYLSMVLEGDAGDINETQKKMLGQAFVSSQRMVYLIADLLNVSRLRTGKFIIDAKPTNLANMVGEELDQLVETASARDIQLTYAKPKTFPDLMLDETKTRQVIMNFVDNAIYYTPSGGHIRVELEETPTSVELKVVDDGIGVPKAEQHHLFTKFYRAGNARKARPDGTGLGLYMAKKVILAQGGSIIFESKEAKGSTFGFLFPKNSAHLSRPAPVREVPLAQ